MGKPKVPKVTPPDPHEIIAAQTEANRIGTSGPFGSTRYEGNNLVTELSPEFQGLVDRGIGLAGQDSERYQAPEFVNELGNALAQRLGSSFGTNITPNSKPAIGQDLPTANFPTQQAPPTEYAQLRPAQAPAPGNYGQQGSAGMNTRIR